MKSHWKNCHLLLYIRIKFSYPQESIIHRYLIIIKRVIFYELNRRRKKCYYYYYYYYTVRSHAIFVYRLSFMPAPVARQ